MVERGKLPKNWAIGTFDVLFENVTSSKLKLPQKQYKQTGRHPVIDQGQNLIGGYTEKDELLHPNILPVIVFGDHTRCAKYIDFKFVQGADGVKVLLPSRFLDQKYAYYLIKTADLPDKGYSRHFKFLRGCSFRIPPFNEQKRIVAKIEELQSHSRKASEALETIPDLLEQLRQSILAAAFRGDLTKKWREQNKGRIEPAAELLKRIRIERRKRWEVAELDKLKAKGLTGDQLDAQFAKRRKQYQEPAPVDTTGLPELPEAWCWASWNEVGFCQNGRAFPSKYYSEEGVKLLRPGNLNVSGAIEWTQDNTRYLPAEWAEEHKEYIIGPEELVINLTAQSLKDEFLGRICMTGLNEFCLLNQRIARLSPMLLSPIFILWLFKSPIFRRFVDKLNTGSLIQHMFTTQIYNFVFPLPPVKEQDVLLKIIEDIMDLKFRFESNMVSSRDQLAVFDQSVFNKAFLGKLVPQDPHDEPAKILLERIRAT